MLGVASIVLANSSVASVRSHCVRKRCPAPAVQGRPLSKAGKLHSVMSIGRFAIE